MEKGNSPSLEILYRTHNECAFSDGVKLEWTDKVRHLGNFNDTTCTDYVDCIVKKVSFHWLC